MLETIDFSAEKIAKADYKPIHDGLIEKLVVLQQQARDQGVGLVVLFEGWNGAGKGSRISDLLYNLDARATSVYVTEDIKIEEAEAFSELHQGVSGYFPRMQEFWNALGPRGNITFFDRGWYTTALQQLLFNEFGRKLGADKKRNKKKKMQAAGLADYVDSVAEFERQLTDDGYVVMKFFLHISEEEQKRRLNALYKDPTTRWRVSKEKLSRIGNYKHAYKIYDHLLSRSDFSETPWVVVNAEDKRRANLEIASSIVAALELAVEGTKDPATQAAAEKAQANSSGALTDDDPKNRSAADAAEVLRQAETEAQVAAAAAPRSSRFALVAHPPSLENVDHSLVLSREDYRKALKHEQERLRQLELEMYLKRIPLMVMYEGWDAAGKGGNIKRVAQALDARAYTIFPSPAPSKMELLHPHLWRYWTRLPKAGHVGIYDRSWYGRVLVERVEGFASETEWARAYDEINGFEKELDRWGAILLKFWVDIDQETQLARFKEREANPSKQWKITDEDWRNRDKYPQYKAAVEDMFRLTSTPHAPWIILESDDKRHARIKALKTINQSLEARLHQS